MHPFQCSHCQAHVFFENDACLSCGALLAYAPMARRMLALRPQAGLPDPAGPWPSADGGPGLRPCANRAAEAHCNWLLDADEPASQTLCCSCRLTTVLPSLDNPANGPRWQRIEQAKRRLVFTLINLGLAPQPKLGADDPSGLAFHLLEDQPGAASVQTGHDRGTITLNVAEADDDHRETQRVRLGEPARTLLGHLRHEAAHYLQYRWVPEGPATDTCRASFGDDRADYAQALARHYAQGAPADWAQHFISAYASSHPWEDWAETCAHYLLVVDAVQTASAWGLQLTSPVAHTSPLPTDTSDGATDNATPPAQEPDVQQLALEHWLPVAQFLNAMNRSLGHRDSYPFQLPPDVLHKMGVVQQLLRAAAVDNATGVRP